MDAMIAAAAHALASGDLLGALKRVALREDAPALALRGIAMAQLGDLPRARELLKQAGRAFTPREAVARARCLVAEAEIALVSRDLAWQPQALATARATLEAHGDRLNAAHARHIEVRRLLLMGRIGEAEKLLADMVRGPLPAALYAGYALAAAGIAMRRWRAGDAAEALQRARRAAQASHIAALMAEVDSAALALHAPVARLLTHGGQSLQVGDVEQGEQREQSQQSRQRELRLADVEALAASAALVVDACRNTIWQGNGSGHATIHLGSRPVLFALARILAEASPGDVPRQTLVTGAFRGKEADESYRARLRVEIGRLRSAIRDLADIRATKAGFQLIPHGERPVCVLVPLQEDQHATLPALLALLADGESWSSSALAIALNTSPRTIQRALETLSAAGKVQAFGRGRARRWTLPSIPGFPSVLLLPAANPLDVG